MFYCCENSNLNILVLYNHRSRWLTPRFPECTGSGHGLGLLATAQGETLYTLHSARGPQPQICSQFGRCDYL